MNKNTLLLKAKSLGGNTKTAPQSYVTNDVSYL